MTARIAKLRRLGRFAVAPVMLLAICSALPACLDATEGPYADHEELADYDAELQGVAPPDALVMPSQFNKNVIVWDKHFTASMSASAIQRFLDRTPYGNRTWLANEKIGTQTLAQALVAIGEEFEINPLMLLARMQVERSAISKTTRPRSHDVNFLMGCGCPDNKPCQTQYKGLDKQLRCAASKLRKHFDGSRLGTGAWRKGTSRRSLDRIAVTPGNHATAALYAYTPWVGNGGNTLVFNVTLKFTAHAQAQAHTQSN